MKKVHHYSSSQIKTYRMCPRKWGFDKIENIPRAPNPAADEGRAIHALLEKYLATGEPPHGKWAPVVLEAIRHLPMPKQGQVERKFEMDLGGLGKLIGYIDYQEPGLVIDHKTTSNLRWAMTSDELIDDVQAIIYAKAHGKEKVTLQWHYSQRTPKRPKHKLVERTILLSDIDKQWAGVLTSIIEMKDIHDSELRANDLQPNTDSCNAFGGCDYRSMCILKETDFTTMKTIKEKMAERKALKEASKEVTVVEKAPELPPEPKPPIVVEVAAINPPESKKRGRPAWIKNKPKAESLEATAVSARPFTLYLDCAPVKSLKAEESCVAFEALIAPVLESLHIEHGCHYRLAPDLFGGAPSLVSDSLKAYLAEKPLPAGVSVTMSLGSTEARDCLQVMIASAGSVIRGF